MGEDVFRADEVAARLTRANLTLLLEETFRELTVSLDSFHQAQHALHERVEALLRVLVLIRQIREQAAAVGLVDLADDHRQTLARVTEACQRVQLLREFWMSGLEGRPLNG